RAADRVDEDRFMVLPFQPQTRIPVDSQPLPRVQIVAQLCRIPTMRSRTIRQILRCLLLLAIAALAALRAADPVPPELKYRAIRRIPLKGDTGWDYLVVDEKARKLYVTRGNFVSVLDADSGDLVGEIADTPGVHGVALAPELGQGYISNGRDNSV